MCKISCPDFLSNNKYIEHETVSLSELPEQPTEIKSNVATNELLFPDAESFDELKKIFAEQKRKSMGLDSNNEAFSLEELENAEKAIIIQLQSQFFDDEIKLLKSDKRLKKSNQLMKLSPFLDSDDIMRVGGRLSRADIPYSAQHQILLPGKSAITRLMVKHFHEKCMHGGPKLTESVMRQHFWVTNSQRSIKAVIAKCHNCFRVNPKPLQQYMADLPKVRVNTVNKPFHDVAVDYTGAFLVKATNTRGCTSQKAYVSIFVCMATKAIHIEAVTALTAEAFIAAFRRFVARRGAVRALYSDNGTNFVKSNKILLEHQAIADGQNYHATVCRELVNTKQDGFSLRQERLILTGWPRRPLNLINFT